MSQCLPELVYSGATSINLIKEGEVVEGRGEGGEGERRKKRKRRRYKIKKEQRKSSKRRKDRRGESQRKYERPIYLLILINLRQPRSTPRRTQRNAG